MVGAIQNRDDSGGSPLNISETKPTGLDPRGSETGMGRCDVTSASQRANDLPPLGLSHPTWKMFVMVSEAFEKSLMLGKIEGRRRRGRQRMR